MVFQRKSGGKGNKSPFQGKNKKPFEHDSKLDDQLMKKTPKGKQSLGTPKGKQASFQVPGKNTPANRTPKFVAKTPNSGVKKLLTPGYKGTTMKEFQGMKAGFNRPKNGMKDEDSSDDEEEDDDDEDLDLDVGGGDNENEGDEDDDDENEGDEDDDDENEDDDKNEDDDENEGDEDDDDENEGDKNDEEEEMLDKHKKVMETNKEGKVKTPKSEKVEATKPRKSTQVVKSEAKSSPNKVPDQREKNLRTLYIGNLPPDIEPEEIKTLSSDILEVRLPKSKYGVWRGTNRFAFVDFISNEKAEANRKDLQEKTLRGAKLIINFDGEIGHRWKTSEIHDPAKKNYSKILFIQGFPSNIKIDKVAEIFPKSHQITMTESNCAHVTFGTFEEAAAGFEAGKKATVEGTQLKVEYINANESFSPNKRKEHFKKPFQKKMKFVK